MANPLWWILLALAFIFIGLYAIERTLLAILKTLRAMRLETKVDVSQFLRDDSGVPDRETPAAARKAN